jgi:hypothetical protein
VNHGIGDDEIATIEAQANAAAPGEWKALPSLARASGCVARFNGAIVDDDASIRFMAAARGNVPRLIRWIRVLEEALATANATASSWRRTVDRERVEHEAALERARGPQGTGPEVGISLLLHAARLGVADDAHAVHLVRRWSRGEDIADEAGRLVRSVEGRVAVAFTRGVEPTPDEQQDARDFASGGATLADLARRYRARLDEAFRNRARIEAREVVTTIGEAAARKFFDAGLRAVRELDACQHLTAERKSEEYAVEPYTP